MFLKKGRCKKQPFASSPSGKQKERVFRCVRGLLQVGFPVIFGWLRPLFYLDILLCFWAPVLWDFRQSLFPRGCGHLKNKC